MTEQFEPQRYLLAAGYADRLAPILDRTWPDMFSVFNKEDADVMAGLDTFLNFLEQILCLERKEQIKTEEHRQVLKWCLDLMKHPDRASLRYYLRLYGFELLSEEVTPQTGFYLVTYGTLLSQDRGDHDGKPDVSTLMSEPSKVKIPGRLYDSGWYPVLVPNEPGEVDAELSRFITSGDPERDIARAIELLDAYEGYDPANPDGSEYLRQVIRVNCPLRGTVDAWVYTYNRPAGGLRKINSGNWLDYMAAQPDGT